MRLIVVVALVLVATGAFAKESAHAPSLTAEQIVQKNVEARGGLAAWRKIQTMVWIGHLETSNAQLQKLPFILEQKRPNKTRFEINAKGQRTLRIFDGMRGWNVKPEHEGRMDAQPYSPQELKFAHDAQAIDGPLIDYEAKGGGVALEGTEVLEGRKTYRLTVRLASGDVQNVWIDAETFLDVRYDRKSYRSDGGASAVSVFYRRYMTVEGLQIPSTMEIGVGSGKVPDKMVLEKVVLNSPLDDRVFRPPGMTARANGLPTAPRPPSSIAAPALPAAPDPGSQPR
jgi:outer membrane lipoprotein-sorting protein